MADRTAEHPTPTEAEAVGTTDATRSGETAAGADDALVVEDLLVEEVSIDGMCGVY